MSGLLADLKHAFRLYRRTPLSSLIAVAVLAVAMAFVGAFVSLYVDLVLRPHPGFEQSGQIVTMGQNDGSQLGGVPYQLIDRMADEVTTLEAVVGVQTFSQEVGPEKETVPVELVTNGLFDGLRPRLALGRGFEESEHEPDGEPVVVLSHRYWQQQLGGDPNVLDTTIEMTLNQMMVRIGPDGQPEQRESETLDFRIIGVMAAEMPGLQTDQAALWMTVERGAPALFGGLESVRGLAFRAFARMSAGVSESALVRQINARYLDADEDFNLQSGFRLDAVKGVVRDINVHRDAERQLKLFLTASVLLALVAACNVSLFLLARAPGRRRELGIRMAVGAPLKRLARQLGTEAAVLVVVAAGLGLALSIWLSGVLRGLAFLQQAQWTDVSLLDWRVLGLVGLFLLLLTLAVSLAPVLGLKRLGIAASSRQVAARATAAQRVAGTVQIAIAGVLAAAAIAFGWYLGQLTLAYPGYQTRNLYVASFRPTTNDVLSFNITTDNSVVEFARRREAIEALPGVTRASFGSPVPGRPSTGGFTLAHQDDPTQRVRVQIGRLDSGFIDILGLRLAGGRVPSEGETGVALVNQALAREVFGRDDVVGESLPYSFPGVERVEIAGVLEDVSFGHPTADVEPLLFAAAIPSFFFSTSAVIESTGSAADLTRQVQQIVDDGSLELGLQSVRPLTELRSELIAADRARSLLTIGTACLVVVLAAFGFYGTQRYLVTAGRREYAIRASLGAGPRALGRLVLARGLRLSLPGIAIGLLLAFTTAAWLRGDFVPREVSPSTVALAVAAGLVLLVLVASIGPARQAKRTQPAPLLREE